MLKSLLVQLACGHAAAKPQPQVTPARWLEITVRADRARAARSARLAAGEPEPLIVHHHPDALDIVVATFKGA